MATFSYPVSYSIIKCSSNRDHHEKNVQKLNNIKINGASSVPKIDVTLSQAASTSFASVAKNGVVTDEQLRQNMPTKKQLVDPYRQGLIIDEGVEYKQTVVIRSYEVGPDKTATLESILNLLQETALNHVWMSGLLSDRFGTTHGMMRNNLIWAVSRMQVQVDQYPIWGEVIDIDTWVGASGKNGMRRDWLIQSQATGHVLARGTSTWVMMNRKTSRLSKMPEEVRAEISPWFIEKYAIKEDVHEKIVKLDDKAKYMNNDLKPTRSDLDMNHHVNNVKYVRWMLEVNKLGQSFSLFELSFTLIKYVRWYMNTDLKVLDQSPASSLEKVKWDLIKMGEQVSKQATIVEMLWTGASPRAKERKENMEVRMQQGFLLLSHGSAVGAGPTLSSSVLATVKQVVGCSFKLLKEFVSLLLREANKDENLTIVPQLVSAVCEACSALNKTPGSNVTAIGRAMTQVAVSIKDVLREMKELKPDSPDSTDETPDQTCMKDESEPHDDGSS